MASPLAPPTPPSLAPPTPPLPSASSSFHHRTRPSLTSTRLSPPPSHLIFHPSPSLLPFSLNLHRPHPLVVHSPYASLSSLSPLNSNDDNEDEEKTVREAVRDILREFGVSEEESREIAAKSRKYVTMLLDGVRELDEVGLWRSWMMERGEGGGQGVEEELSLRRKVWLLVREKGDGGKIAYLESLGFSLGTAGRIARVLASETAVGLIRRVMYVKGIFFSGSDDQKFIGKRARKMMLHLSISVDEDLQQTMSFFEKLEARRGGLDMLAFEDASFVNLIESFPGILSLSIEATIKPVLEFLGEIGMPRQSFGSVLLLYPPILFLDIEKDIKPGMEVLHKVDILRKNIGRMVYKYPWILCSSILRNFEEVVSSLEANKVPKVGIYGAIKSLPLLLGCSSCKFRPMMMQLHKLGVKGGKLGKVLTKSPQLLLRKPQEFLKVVAFLQSFGFDEEVVGKIIIRCPDMFPASVDNTLQRKVDFLTSIGMSKHQLPRVIKKFPELFVLDVETHVPARLNYLMSIGFSKREITLMISRFSPLLGYSIEVVLRPKLELLMNTMERPLSDVVDYPRYFSYSLEKKIKPRFFVLKSRNLSCSLKDMLGKNDDEFVTEYLGIERMLIPPS